MRKYLRRTLFVTALVLGAVPAVALADTPEAAAGASLGDELAGTAKTDYLAGRALFSDGDFAGALVKFQSALDASKDNRLLWNIGVCHRGLRHYAEAIRTFERFKEEGGPKVTDEQRTRASEFVAGLQPYVAALTVRSPEADAFVYVDGKLAGPAPLERYQVDLGEHSVVVMKARLSDFKTKITATGNADIIVDAPLAHEGRIIVRAGAGDVIAIDGRAVAASSYEGTLPNGAHKLRVSAPGKKASESDVVIEDGQTRTFDITLDRDGLPLWAWIGIGAATAVGASIAGYFLFQPGDPTRPSAVIGSLPPGTHQTSLRW